MIEIMIFEIVKGTLKKKTNISVFVFSHNHLFRLLVIEIVIFEIIKGTLKKRQTFQYLYFQITISIEIVIFEIIKGMLRKKTNISEK